MNFKDLREANLSKAQINKVHDKADDLPKSDFIKRYGKEGDAVRFATATNIIKKQLGIGESVKEGGPGSGPQVDVKQKKKDKADTQRLLDRQKRLQSIGKRNEEVVTEAVSDAYVKQIAKMTDNNDHFGARIELARMMRDKELMQMYDSLEKMHRMNLGGNDALTLRSKLDKNLKFRLTQKVKKDADRLMGAL